MRSTFLILLLISYNACTTKKEEKESTPQLEISNTEMPVTDTTDKAISAKFVIPKTEAEELYGLMKKIKKELQPMAKENETNLRSETGIISCKYDKNFNNCFFHMRLEEDKKLNGPYSLPKAILKELTIFLQKNIDMKSADVIKSDVVCDYIGKNSPPYGAEKLDCIIKNPRSLNEAYFEDKIAENLVDLLSNNSISPETNSIAQGSILCQKVRGTTRTPCVVRPIKQGVLLDKFFEVPAKYSKILSKQLYETLLDSYNYSNPSGKAFEEPSEIIGNITCNINSKDFQTFGRRQIICKINI